MNTRITNIGQLVSAARSSAEAGPVLEVREQTQLLLHDGRIAAVGPSDQRVAIDAEFDAAGRVVLPGLVDPHTHFGGRRTEGDESPPKDGARRDLSRRLRRALADGVTTVEVKCAGLCELEAVAALQRDADERLPEIVRTLYGAPPPLGVPHAQWMAQLIGEAIPTSRRRRLAEFCDVACGDGAYTLDEARAILRAARGAGLRLTLHACGAAGGPLRNLAAEVGAAAIGHPTVSALGDAEEWGRLDAVPLLVPGDTFVDAPARRAVKMPKGAPRIGLGTNAGGGEVAIGSMWLVIALAVCELGMPLERALAAATARNAHALEAGAEIGTIEVGKRADLVILDLDDYRDLHRCLGEAPVHAVIRRGKVVHGR